MNMNKILFYIILSIVGLFTSCENFSDEFGYTMTFGIPEVKTVKAEVDKYSIELSCPFNVNAGHMDIEEAGFILCSNETSDSKIIKGEVIDGSIVAVLSDLYYDIYYTPQPYIETSVGTLKNEFYGSVEFSKQDFAPSYSSYVIELVANGQYKVSLEYGLRDESFDLTDASAEISGLQLDTEIVGNTVVAYFEISDMTSSYYNEINFILRNSMGGTKVSIPVKFLLSDAVTVYSGDGNKDDCIRLCGVDWAKGNLQYDNGTWKIAETQDSNFGNTISPNKLEYFCFGSIDAVVKKQNHYFDLPGIEDSEYYYDIKGNKSIDVAAANLSGDWSIPNSDELSALLESASYQYGYVTRNGKDTYGYIFYNSGKRIVKSETPVRIGADNLDDIGLFLPLIGYYDIYQGELHESFYYMSSEVHTTEFYNNYTWGYVQSLRYLYSGLGVTDDGYVSYLYQVPVRPVKMNK